jgi:hypothetical protein
MKVDLSKKARASLEKVIEFAETGQLCAKGTSSWGRTHMMYHDPATRTFCALGCLMSKKTLKMLDKNGCNFDDVGDLYSNEFLTMPKNIGGFTLEQAAQIQDLHDYWADGDIKQSQFIKPIQAVLDGKGHKRLSEFSKDS